MPKNFYTVLLMSIGLLFGTAAHAEIFKWVDANGITHYSDSATTTRQTQTLDFGQLHRPAPNRQVRGLPRETRKFFPGKPRKVRQRVAPQRPRVKRQTIQKPRIARRYNSANQSRTAQRSVSAKQPRATKRRAAIKKSTISKAIITPALQEAPVQQCVEFELFEESEPTEMVTSEPEPLPNLNAKEYDMRHEQKKNIQNVKQKLCTGKRMLLAALQEKGFDSYYDEEGHYRIAWGGDGIYQGKRRFLSAEEVAQKTEKVLFEVGQYCENPSDLRHQQAARANWIRAEYCKLSKAVLEDLEHPFMRATEKRIKRQTEEVERLCSEMKTNQYRNDRRYYPPVLQAKVALPRHLKLKEDEASEITTKKPEETIEQLLALIQ